MGGQNLNKTYIVCHTLLKYMYLASIVPTFSCILPRYDKVDKECIKPNINSTTPLEQGKELNVLMPYPLIKAESQHHPRPMFTSMGVGLGVSSAKYQVCRPIPFNIHLPPNR